MQTANVIDHGGMGEQEQELRRQKVGRMMLTLVLAYCILCIAMTFGQRSLMYFPDRGVFNPAAWGMSEFRPMRLTTDDGLTITSWYHAPRDASKPTIVFMQGNAGHPGQRNFKVLPWVGAGYGLVMVGYRGFGVNPGSPTEQGLYRDARAVLNDLKMRGITDRKLILYGESIGTGITVQMATEYSAAGVILESPYTSTGDVGAWRYPFLPVRHLIWDRFDSLSKIANVHMPLMIMHGEADMVVPAQFGKKLYAAANEPKRAMFMAGLDHSTIYDSAVHAAVMEFMASLTQDKESSRAGTITATSGYGMEKTP
ncbi:MAG: alpha/beta hydrolase [Alphaproteobacteria bacterium]